MHITINAYHTRAKWAKINAYHYSLQTWRYITLLAIAKISSILKQSVSNCSNLSSRSRQLTLRTWRTGCRREVSLGEPQQSLPSLPSRAQQLLIYHPDLLFLSNFLKRISLFDQLQRTKPVGIFQEEIVSTLHRQGGYILGFVDEYQLVAKEMCDRANRWTSQPPSCQQFV